MTLTTPMKVILAVVLIGVIGLGFYLLDWQKKMADKQTLNDSLAGKSQEYDRIRNETKSLTALVQENDSLNREFTEMMRHGGQTPTKGGGTNQDDNVDFVPDFISQIEVVVGQVAQEKSDSGANGFQIVSITPGTGAVTGDKKKDDVPSVIAQVLEKLPKRKFQISLKGKYESLVAFLDKLGALALNRLVTVDKVTLAPAGGEKDAHPPLTITLPLTAYLKGGAQ